MSPPTLSDAIILATEAHKDQERLDGSPYIIHPLRVMMRFEHKALMTIAVLHDVVEDTEITLEQLKELGFPNKVVKAIDALTRRENETYMEFIERIDQNDLARQVKIADIQDNLEPDTFPSMAKRYIPALKFLQRDRVSGVE